MICARFVAWKIVRHFYMWEKVTVVFTIVTFIGAGCWAEMNTRYNGVYHVLRTLEFIDTNDRKRSDQFIDTTMAGNTFVEFIDTNVDDF